MVCGLLFSVMTFAQAQEGERTRPTAEEMASAMTSQLKGKLDLSADQQAKIHDILLEQQKGMEKLRGQDSGDRKNMREEMKKQMEDSDNQINGVLTEEQRKTFAAYREERKAAMQRRRDRQVEVRHETN